MNNVHDAMNLSEKRTWLKQSKVHEREPQPTKPATRAEPNRTTSRVGMFSFGIALSPAHRPIA